MRLMLLALLYFFLCIASKAFIVWSLILGDGVPRSIPSDCWESLTWLVWLSGGFWPGCILADENEISSSGIFV